MIIPVRGPDIIELERLLDAGEGDDDLCQQAIAINKRLDDEMNQAGRKQQDALKRERIKLQRVDFQRVIADIRRRRHDQALRRYDDEIYRRRHKTA